MLLKPRKDILALSLMVSAGSAVFFSGCNNLQNAANPSPHLLPVQQQIQNQPAASPSSATPIATSCDLHFFDRQNLQNLSQTGKIETIAQIIQMAPDCFKANQVAVYKSHSLHCANTKAPRMILYANNEDNGTTVCSFNSGQKSDYPEFYSAAPDRDCHENALECQQFNPQTSRFEYFQVTVPKNDQGQLFNTSVLNTVVSDANPSTCLTCHRGNTKFLGNPNPRPNLENYPAWPGMYGSMHDKFDATSSEKINYINDYLAYRPNNARYEALPVIVDGNGRYTGENNKPTVNLQNILASQSLKRIASEFTDIKLIDKANPFRYALLASLACSDEGKSYDANDNIVPPQWKYGIETFIPAALIARFQTSYSQFASEAFRLQKKNIQSLHDTQVLAGPFSFDQFETQYEQDIKVDPMSPMPSWQLSSDTASEFWYESRLGYLGFNLGLPVWDWSMTFQSTLSFEAGDHNFRQIFPLLAAAFLDSKADADLDTSRASIYGASADDKLCKSLQVKSLAALASVAASANDFRLISTIIKPISGGAFSGSGNSSNIGTPPPSLKACISCHVTGNAIPIPFDHPSDLREAFFSPATTNSSHLLIDEIIQRIDSGSMPKNIPISTAEQTDLKDYFLGLFTN
jgi:hypothetical protein